MVLGTDSRKGTHDTAPRRHEGKRQCGCSPLTVLAMRRLVSEKGIRERRQPQGGGCYLSKNVVQQGIMCVVIHGLVPERKNEGGVHSVRSTGADWKGAKK